jgi:hypothetical protein
MPECITIFDHKWDQASLVIMNMNNIGQMLPFAQPITNSNLKCSKSFRVIIITINFFPVKQTIYINKEKIKSKSICLLFYNTVMKPFGSEVLASFMHELPIIVIQEFCTVHWHDNFCYMSKLVLIFWQRSHHITKTAGFGHRVAFR